MSISKANLRFTASLVVAAAAGALLATALHGGNSPSGGGASGKKSATAVTGNGVLSPSDLSRDFTQYANKEVAVRGTLTRHNGTYYLMELGSKRSAGFVLDVSGSSLDMSSFFEGTSVQSKSQHTVHGIFHVTKSGKSYTNIAIAVKSID